MYVDYEKMSSEQWMLEACALRSNVQHWGCGLGAAGLRFRVLVSLGINI